MLIDHQDLNGLPLHLEHAPELASILGVGEVLLVREDNLRDGGGKKRRSYNSMAEKIPAGRPVHILSYAGAHTVFTLATLRPDLQFISHGKFYNGGSYQDYMIDRLDELPNVRQKNGTLLGATFGYLMARLFDPGDTFLKIGGAQSTDDGYVAAAKILKASIGDEYHHIVPVASGNLVQAIGQIFDRITGVLIQPWYLRAIMRLRIKRARGLLQTSYTIREIFVRHIYETTGLPIDPVFMGTAISYAANNFTTRDRLCIWVTCPSIVREYHTELAGSTNNESLVTI